MYERFTDRARKVMQFANQEAQRFNHEYIGTEHILLGLVKEGSGVAANVLKNMDVDLRKVRLEIEKLVQSGPDMVIMGKLPMTPRAKKVIEFSMNEARALHHNYVGTEHILLGLLLEHEGCAAQVLMNLGVDHAEVREEVMMLLGHSETPKTGWVFESPKPKRTKEQYLESISDPEQRARLKAKIEAMLFEKEEAVVNQDFEKASQIRDEMKKVLAECVPPEPPVDDMTIVRAIACLSVSCLCGAENAEYTLAQIRSIL